MSRQGAGWQAGSLGGSGSMSHSAADSGRDTVFSSDGSSCCEAGEGPGGGGGGASSGSSSSGVGSSHTPTANTPTTPTTPTAPEPTRPPRITPFSGVLSQGKAVIRPIAFRPLQGAMSPGPGASPNGGGGGSGGGGGGGSGGRQGAVAGGRLSNAGERYGSTPVLARPGTRLALHGSTTDLRSLHSGGSTHMGGGLGGGLGLGPLGGSLHGGLGPLGGSGSHLSLDRKLTLCSSPPLSSLPLPLPGRLEGRLDCRYDPLSASSTLTAPSRAGSVDRNIGHSHRSDAAMRRLPLVGLPLSAMHHGSADRVDGDLDGPGLPPDLELEAALRGRDSELAVRQVITREERAERGGWARELRRLQHASDSRLRQHSLGQHAERERHAERHALALQHAERQQQRERHAERHARELGGEVRLLRSRLEETSWALHQRNGELSLLKAQLKEALSHQEQASRLAGRAQEAAALRAQLDAERASLSGLRRTLAERDAELQRAADARDAALRDAAELRAVARHLEAELELAVAQAKGSQAVLKHQHQHQGAGGGGAGAGAGGEHHEAHQLRAEVRRLRDELATERATWAEEKEKVLRYQRQLQLNYVQMFRRTRSLEAEVESLTMELELETKANKHKKAYAKGKGLPLPELHAQAIEL
ncbi:Leucine zipper putative tumor suppressor 2 [Frankliniella fusca]|uniref:Leucine zipper putative tumor suppressor 2 n=1 Tax=Frankliniella fusca TaxID=407009 RepID=A0AAE1LKH1_9NEOP|nr:Leucine zipper putative tumor suppressor 2 [Frankliniella fusca]